MADPFIGEICMFAGTYAPRYWAFCDNTLIPVNENSALFSLLGNKYGGDGRTTFALPDMRGRLPVHQGTGPGLSQRRLGERLGTEQVTLTEAQLPYHTHQLCGSKDSAVSAMPQNTVLAAGQQVYGATSTSPVAMAAEQIGNNGGSEPHANVMPFLCINFIIALQGMYPQRD